MGDKGGNVFRSFSQRRHFEADDIEPVEQIGAEVTAVDGGDEIDAGGGDEADVDGERDHAADTLHHPGFQRAEQLGLHGLRHVPDFIEKEGAGVGGFEAAGAGAGGAGEGAGFMAEHFGFEEIGGDSGAIEGDEGGCGAAAALMEELGGDVFSGA